VTGSYLCDKEGRYVIEIFRSNSPSGYSFTLSGLEEGTFAAWTEVKFPLGNCGLSIKFDEDTRYRNGTWTITIPNTQSSVYATNLNTYNLALKQREKSVSTAELSLELAKKNEIYSNADATPETISKINAQIETAKAKLRRQEANITNFTIRAPFDGTITDINMKGGETSDQSKQIMLVDEGSFVLKARVPEVDIRHIAVGTPAEVIFDASAREVLPTTIEYISPLSTDIDGVAYYEARLRLTTQPNWIREGMNADITIVINEKDNTLVIPKQYLETEGAETYVSVVSGETITRTPVKTGIIGNDGFVEVLNLDKGTKLVLP
jgi:RND family efflux transporter MFP subunit